MAMAVVTEVIDALQLGVGGRRRELQDFPVLGDVWARFAEEPTWQAKDREVANGKRQVGAAKEQDLLITSTWERPTGEVAKLIVRFGGDQGSSYDRRVAYLQDLVVASLTLGDLIEVVVPATMWWDQINEVWENPEDAAEDDEEDSPPDSAGPPTDATLHDWIRWELVETIREERTEGRLTDGSGASSDYLAMGAQDRQAAKLGVLLGVLLTAAEAASPPDRSPPAPPAKTIEDLANDLGQDLIVAAGAKAIRRIIERHAEFAQIIATTGDRKPWKGLIFQVSLNRESTPAITESVPAIKADAARSLFSISCRDIGWAVLDSGIDQTHPAFWDYEQIWKDQEKAAKEAANAPPSPPPGPPRTAWAARLSGPVPHRIKATFDFRRIRAIMSVSVEVEALAQDLQACSDLDPEQIRVRLQEIAENHRKGKRVNWAAIRPLIEKKHAETPPHPHGTHVAGIIGAHWFNYNKKDGPRRTDPVRMSGVCPDIGLYDFRVLGSDLGDSEFAVIAAMQFIRFLNDQSGYSVIHGANMSLSIPHNVRNYACGRTQVCLEAESLTANGVVVVAAAGNRGYQQYKLADNTLFESYAASSITDPGNAEGVITVGATHRAWPHTYGVSFFSSRGPTGDGRMKPDLLAPGEKVTSCIPNGGSDQMDGTSMAAPHVSGAAALLMARHQELKGQAVKIKEILCATATDLKRERSFQGHGMVDVLRAIQSI